MSKHDSRTEPNCITVQILCEYIIVRVFSKAYDSLHDQCVDKSYTVLEVDIVRSFHWVARLGEVSCPIRVSNCAISCCAAGTDGWSLEYGKAGVGSDRKSCNRASDIASRAFGSSNSIGLSAPL
jgi:hypothetical protein